MSGLQFQFYGKERTTAEPYLAQFGCYQGKDSCKQESSAFPTTANRFGYRKVSGWVLIVPPSSPTVPLQINFKSLLVKNNISWTSGRIPGPRGFRPNNLRHRPASSLTTSAV